MQFKLKQSTSNFIQGLIFPFDFVYRRLIAPCHLFLPERRLSERKLFVLWLEIFIRDLLRYLDCLIAEEPGLSFLQRLEFVFRIVDLLVQRFLLL